MSGRAPKLKRTLKSPGGFRLKVIRRSPISYFGSQLAGRALPIEPRQRTIAAAAMANRVPEADEIVTDGSNNAHAADDNTTPWVNFDHWSAATKRQVLGTRGGTLIAVILAATGVIGHQAGGCADAAPTRQHRGRC